LERCVASILDQTYSHWELLIINDGSTEDIKTHIKQYLCDPRVRYFRLAENKGNNYASNFALEKALKAGTDYITFLDDDDCFSKDCLRMADSIIRENPTYNWFLSACVKKDGSKTKIKKYGRVDYVQDYFFGNKISGDATHFVNANRIGKVRFPVTVKNYNSELFFFELAKTEKIFVYDFTSKFVDYQPDGLTKEARVNRSKESWQISMRICLESLHMHPLNFRIYRKMLLRTLEFVVSSYSRSFNKT